MPPQRQPTRPAAPGEAHPMCTDRDWIKATIAHQQTPAVPYNLSLTPPARAALETHYHTDDVKEALHLPIRTSSCGSTKPFYASPAEFGETVTDEFGVVWSTSDIDRGSPIGAPLAGVDVADWSFPDPAAAYRFEHFDAWLSENRERFTLIWVGELWERATFLRGMENLLLDVALEPALAETLLRATGDHVLRTMEILFDRFAFDAIALSDDYGSQKAMLLSPDHWRRLVKPRLAEIYALAKKHGRYVFHHSCGNIRPIIGDMIEIGLDILHPVQPEAMDLLQLKREFGRDVTFCGGLRTQDLLPTGSPQEIRDEVRRLKDAMGAGGGYILEPGITVQADVPLENVLALVEEASRR